MEEKRNTAKEKQKTKRGYPYKKINRRENERRLKENGI